MDHQPMEFEIKLLYHDLFKSVQPAWPKAQKQLKDVSEDLQQMEMYLRQLRSSTRARWLDLGECLENAFRKWDLMGCRPVHVIYCNY